MTMKTEHKYAQILRWIADGEDVLGSLDGGGEGEFPHDFSPNSIQHVLLGKPGWIFRLKPRTITVNGREIVAGSAVEPERGITYYLPVPHQEGMYGWETWTNNDFDRRTFSRGLVHLTKENAIAHAKAMLGID